MSHSNKKILYFTATWCGPCQRIKPVFKELEQEYPDMSFNSIDVDLNSDLAEKYGVESMPTFVFLFNEKEVNRFSGASADKLKEAIKKLANL